jgi:hypothetical protein
MARIDDSNPIARDIIRKSHGTHPCCDSCSELATIYQLIGPADGATEVYLCDVHALIMATILLEDIGRVKKIIK